ncbi:MAG: hypothetical protein ACYDH9_18045 [Limisphaerales bacterium]
MLLMFARKTQRLKGLAIAVKNVRAARVRFLKDRGSISRIFSMKMNRASNQNATTARITLKEVRALVRADLRVGGEVAEGFHYNAQTLAEQCRCSLRQLLRLFGAKYGAFLPINGELKLLSVMNVIIIIRITRNNKEMCSVTRGHAEKKAL